MTEGEQAVEKGQRSEDAGNMRGCGENLVAEGRAEIRQGEEPIAHARQIRDR